MPRQAGGVSPGGRPRGGWAPWAVGAALLGLAGIVVLATLGNGAILESLLAPLEFLQQPYLELAAASQGADAAEGSEYVAFLADSREAAALDGFFRTHSAVRFVSPGLLPGVAVVRIRGAVSEGVSALRAQPEVRLVVKSRLGMVCH
jgi:hypothetical protein